MTTPTSYILAPNYRYYILNSCGLPAVGGTLTTQDATTGAPRSTYSDPAGLNPNPPVMTLTSDGSPGYPVYWQIVEGGSLYRVTARDAGGNVIWIAPNYPLSESVSGGNVINLYVNADNYFRNEQFPFWHQGTTFTTPDTLPIGTTQICDDWYFTRTNTSADITISQVVWPAGSAEAAFSPRFGIQYQVITPATDTNSDIGQFFESVQTLNNQQVTVGIYAGTTVSTSTAPITLYTTQYFGAGGSTTVTTDIQTITVTDSMQLFIITFTVPSVAGMVIGPNLDDYLQVFFRFNSNLVQTVQIAEVQFQPGVGTSFNFPYRTIEQQFSNDIQLQLINGEPGQGTDLIAIPGKPEYTNLTEWIDDVAPQNFLVGWNFWTNPFQFGSTVTSTTIVKNNDGNYIADQTILISDGDNVVNMANYTAGSGAAPLAFTVVTPTRKFGIFQIVDERNCAQLYYQTCSAMISLATANPTAINFKIAIVGFVGTSGQEPRQVVTPGGWGAPGVNPTLSTGWTYLGVDSFTSGTQTDLMYGVDNVTIPSPMVTTNFQTIGVMVWVDDPSPLIAGSYVAFYQGSGTQTLTHAPCAPETPEETLTACQFYLKKSYQYNGAEPWGYIPSNPSYVQVVNSCPVIAYGGVYTLMATIIADIFTTEPFYSVGAANANVVLSTLFVSGPPTINGGYFANIFALNTQDIVIPFGNSMAKIPTVTIYNSSTGASGTVNLSYGFAPGPNCSPTLNGVSTVNPSISDVRATTEQVTFTLGADQSQCWSAVSTLSFTNNTWEFTFTAPQAACEYVADALLGV